MIGDHTRERPPPHLIADLMHGASGRCTCTAVSAPSRAPRHSSHSVLAERRQRTTQEPGDLDAAAVTDPAVRERLRDRLADPLDSHPRARLATIPPW
jgi:hypothetical protein